jgi:probable F420-dependent oxidoreductase
MARNAEPMICIRPSFELRMKDLQGTLRYAELVEEMGFDAVFVGDRMLAQAASDGKVVYDATAVECTTIMAAMAARTSRIRIGVLIFVVPYRRPLQIAKSFASLDAISEGRIIMGCGVGWNRREFEALGLDMSKRGAMFEEAIPLIRKLWTGEPVTFQGQWSQLDQISIAPLPKQPDGPPIWMASFAPSHDLDFSGGFPKPIAGALDRVGRLADGWAPLTYSASARRRISPEDLARAWEIVGAGAERVGRSPADIDLVHSDWIYIVDGPDGERRGQEAVSKFFTGNWEEAKNTYVIGTPDEVVEQLARQTSRIPRKVDAFLLTPISIEHGQLDLIHDKVAPALRQLNRKS